MRFALLLGCALLVGLSPAQAGHSPPKIFLRVFVQTTGPGLPDNQAHQITVPPDNETILIRAMPELTEGDLVDVRTDSAGNTHLFFSEIGRINLDAATGQNQGRILVVMIDSTVIYAPTIDEQITTGELVIPHPLPPQVVQLLQEIAKRNVKEKNRA